MLSSVFVDRPRLAIVIAIVTTIAGAVSLLVIPVAQYPDVVPPQVSVTTFSVHVRNLLSMSGRFITVLPVSILRFDPGRYALKELPLELPMSRLPVFMATLKDRTLSPAVERFMACTRDVAKAMHTPARKSAKGSSQRGAAKRIPPLALAALPTSGSVSASARGPSKPAPQRKASKAPAP